ncbi:MAG: ABC transporter ATP-binding protein [Steroidobacteraceae bacterium]
MSGTGDTLLSCAALDIAVQERVLVEQLSLNVAAGSITAVLGRNGTGKSLTLHTLAGLRAHQTGAIHLQARSLSDYTRREIAQRLSFVPQDFEEPFPVSVLDCAVSGRHPHIGFWQWESVHDYELARAALNTVDLAAFTHRNVATLSGGERRRLAIATALTQDPAIFILDEPTNHLDPQHQLQVLNLLRHKANAGSAVIMSLHEPNLAVRFADHALLLFGDGRWLHGKCTDIVSASNLSQLYDTPIQELTTAHARYFISI